MALGTEIALIKALGGNGGGGTGGGVLVVNGTWNDAGTICTLDKTWQEIANAVASTGAVIVAENEGTIVSANVITSAHYDDLSAEYSVFTLYLTYITASASGYPSLNDDDEM